MRKAVGLSRCMATESGRISLKTMSLIGPWSWGKIKSETRTSWAKNTPRERPLSGKDGAWARRFLVGAASRIFSRTLQSRTTTRRHSRSRCTSRKPLSPKKRRRRKRETERTRRKDNWIWRNWRTIIIISQRTTRTEKKRNHSCRWIVSIAATDVGMEHRAGNRWRTRSWSKNMRRTWLRVKTQEIAQNAASCVSLSARDNIKTEVCPPILSTTQIRGGKSSMRAWFDVFY